MPQNTNEELYDLMLYLARHKGDYKLGIPVDGHKYLFIHAEDKDHSRDFLQAFIEKGLGSQINKHDIFLYKDSNKLEEDFLKQLTLKYNPSVIIIFYIDCDLQPGFPFKATSAKSNDVRTLKVAGLEGVKILRAPSIELISEDREIKRQFWNAIKEL